jgi:hypothetical protein
MTDTEVDLETQAHQLAARGREVLVERMRTAYSDAAAAQADLITLDDTHIEAMVQASADRADGLQWRRALAAVAAEEFGISASEALSHPAVTRAQSLVGAPSYEQSLAELMARPVPPPAPTPAPVQATETAVPYSEEPMQYTEDSVHYAEEPSDELESVEADDVVLELLPEPEPDEYVYDAEPEPEPEPEPAAYTAGAEPEPEGERQPEPAATEPQRVEHETQAYDVEASFGQEPVPPAPTNPFAAPAEPEATHEQEPELEPEPEPEPMALAEPVVPPEPVEPAAGADAFEPPTEQHHSAGVAAALEAVSVPGSVPDADEPDPHAAEHHAADEPASAPVEEQIEVSFAAVHLGGVAGLPTKKEGLSVRLSSDGLDIMQDPREIIGRLVWDEIEALEVPNLRVRRRQKTVRARLVVRTPHGDASFEVPEISADELRDRVEPLMRLYGGN